MARWIVTSSMSVVYIGAWVQAGVIRYEANGPWTAWFDTPAGPRERLRRGWSRRCDAKRWVECQAAKWRN